MDADKMYHRTSEPRLNLISVKKSHFFRSAGGNEKRPDLENPDVRDAPQVGLEPTTLRLTGERLEEVRSLIRQRSVAVPVFPEPRFEPESAFF